jgi:flagellar hook protein FlgE
MLPVTNRSGVESGDSAMMLTSTGSFRTDSNGYLTTSGGLVLMGVPADGDGVVPTFSRDTQAALQPIKIDRTKFVGEPTTSIQLGVNLPATDAVAGALGSAQELAVEYYDNLGNSENLIVTFTPTGSNEWEMAFSDPSLTTYTLLFDDSRSNGGALADIMDSSGASIATSFTGEIELTMDAGPISVNIGELGSGGGLSQLGGTFAPTSISKNGSPVGNMISIEVNEKGIVQGVFDTGTTRALYQVPIVDVPNPNGLKAGNQQTFSISQNSGSFYLWDAGSGPVGDVVSYAREESTTDVAAELTQLIQTQRAYSTNAKVIQTVDEMLQETTNIKR